MNSGALELLEAISVLQSEPANDGSENMRELGSILRTANASLGQAWFNTHASFSKTKMLVNKILEGVYQSTQSFSTATFENEQRATEAAEQFNNVTNNYNSVLDSISSKYGISGED